MEAADVAAVVVVVVVEVEAVHSHHFVGILPLHLARHCCFFRSHRRARLTLASRSWTSR